MLDSQQRFLSEVNTLCARMCHTMSCELIEWDVLLCVCVCTVKDELECCSWQLQLDTISVGASFCCMCAWVTYMNKPFMRISVGLVEGRKVLDEMLC